jgi:hypothetical protein
MVTMFIKRADKYQGNPCKRGHDGMRYKKTGICVQCAKDAAKKQKADRLAGLTPETHKFAAETT